MFTAKDGMARILGRESGIDKKGLDEVDVASFIKGLIDQNNDLASKLERLQSLAGAVERTESKSEEQTEGSTPEKIALAVRQARDIIKAAEEEAEAIKGSAGDEARGIIAEARRKSEAAERQAQAILAEAAEKVESTMHLAEEEANRLIAEVKEKAEHLVEARIAKAEEEGRRIIEEAVKTAEAEAQRINQEAERVLLMSKKLGEEEIKEKFDRFCEELLSGFGDAGAGTAVSTDRGQMDKKENLALYDGTVELAIRPPIVLDRILKLHRHLRGTPQVKVLTMKRSVDKGLRMQLFLRDRTPLLDILKALPEVKKVAVPRNEAMNRSSSLQTGGRYPVRKILVTTKE